MDLSESVPSFLHFGRFLLRVWHAHQTSTCRKCNRPGHVDKNCPNVICFNCEDLGHVSRDCTDAIHCSICRDTGHTAIDCKFSWYRRPLDVHDDVDDQDKQDAAHAPSTASSHTAAGDNQAPAPTVRGTPMDDDSAVQEESAAAPVLLLVLSMMLPLMIKMHLLLLFLQGGVMLSSYNHFRFYFSQRMD